jgi:tRNA (guanine10-N2)-dimethyltransferase
MINFASPQKASTVLDPFCGTGVILQEAALMGLSVAGSDIEPELIQMSQRNLDWLTDTYKRNFTYDLEVGDARTHQWQFDFDCAVTEGYLGPALTKAPSDDELVKLIQDASSLTLDFLGNLRQQIAPGVNICMTLPAWKHNKQFKRLEILDQIQDLGYTLKDFSPVSQSDLLYFRPDQIVAREIITLRSI